MGIKVYGASDDLIEIEGDICDEIPAPDLYGDENEKAYLAFSDGTVLSIHYDGCWRIAPERKGAATFVNEQCSGDPEDDVYSDVATLDGQEPIRWVVAGPVLV